MKSWPSRSNQAWLIFLSSSPTTHFLKQCRGCLIDFFKKNKWLNFTFFILKYETFGMLLVLFMLPKAAVPLIWWLNCLVEPIVTSCLISVYSHGMPMGFKFLNLCKSKFNWFMHCCLDDLTQCCLTRDIAQAHISFHMWVHVGEWNQSLHSGMWICMITYFAIFILHVFRCTLKCVMCTSKKHVK